MSKMDMRHHPIIEGLKINEDGTEIIFFGEKLYRQEHRRSERKSSMLVVHFNNHTYSVAKLICEAWHGMAENRDYVATRIKEDKGFHYTNLFWAKKGTNPNIKSLKNKRSKLSKISKDDIPKIVKRLKKGDALAAIAKDYGTSDMSISRIKKNHL